MAKLRVLFMTAGDLERWFAAAEEKLGWKVKFVPYGLFDAPQSEFANCLEIRARSYLNQAACAPRPTS